MRAIASDLDKARETLLAELREHALVIGEVTLSSGQTAQYYVDAKRALLRPPAFRAAGELIAAEGRGDRDVVGQLIALQRQNNEARLSVDRQIEQATVLVRA